MRRRKPRLLLSFVFVSFVFVGKKQGETTFLAAVIAARKKNKGQVFSFVAGRSSGESPSSSLAVTDKNSELRLSHYSLHTQGQPSTYSKQRSEGSPTPKLPPGPILLASFAVFPLQTASTESPTTWTAFQRIGTAPRHVAKGWVDGHPTHRGNDRYISYNGDSHIARRGSTRKASIPPNSPREPYPAKILV